MSDTFRRFDHVERSKHREVDGISSGECHIFPKLDGTNASVWAEVSDSGLEFVDLHYIVKCGSRNRVLSEDKDNAGFWAYVSSSDGDRIRAFVLANPHLVLYGEWLVPHTIKGYRDDAWRKFYVFDVFDRDAGSYMHYSTYAPKLDEAGIDYLEPCAIIENPTAPELDELAAKQNYFCKPGEFGEGIVVKNYSWRNFFDRQPWMKVLRAGFGDKKPKPAVDGQEEVIAEALVDGHLVEKEFAKGVLRLQESMKVEPSYVNSEPVYTAFVEENRGKIIGILLAQVFSCVIDEELTARVLKKFGWPTIDFLVLRGAVTRRVKELKPELFS